jgi:hypothetical protein
MMYRGIICDKEITQHIYAERNPGTDAMILKPWQALLHFNPQQEVNRSRGPQNRHSYTASGMNY